MANDVKHNPIRIDTFGADVVISAGTIKVNTIVVEGGASAADTATFISSKGDMVGRVSVGANGVTNQLHFTEPFTFQDGLTFDDSASDLAGGDFIFIYLA